MLRTGLSGAFRAGWRLPGGLMCSGHACPEHLGPGPGCQRALFVPDTLAGSISGRVQAARGPYMLRTGLPGASRAGWRLSGSLMCSGHACPEHFGPGQGYQEALCALDTLVRSISGRVQAAKRPDMLRTRLSGAFRAGSRLPGGLMCSGHACPEHLGPGPGCQGALYAPDRLVRSISGRLEAVREPYVLRTRLSGAFRARSRLPGGLMCSGHACPEHFGPGAGCKEA